MIPGLKLIDDILKGLPENARLREQLATLRSQVEMLQQENLNLKTENQNLRHQKHSQDELPDIQQRIMTLLSTRDDKPLTNEIAETLNISSGDADFHVTELSRDGLITCIDLDMYPGLFLTHEGRRYLINRGI